MNRRRIPLIEALRGIAAVQVLLSHVSPLTFGHAWGVDLFFIISGYVMIGASVDTPTPGAFLARRIGRILPLYWLATIAVFMLTLVIPTSFASTRANVIDLLRSLAFIPYVKASGLVEPILYVGWTLNYEMFFYVIFAASLILPKNIGPLAVIFALVALYGIGQIAHPTGVLAEFYTGWRIIEFALGTTLALAVGSRLDPPLARIPAGPLALLGACSYAIYLCHPFALGIGRALFRESMASNTAIVALSIGLGFLIWKTIDQPVQRMLRDYWAVRRFMTA